MGTHLVTQVNGSHQPLQVLGTGLAGYDETQEGLAVFAELMSGSIDIARLQRISLRILAIDMALRGADFIEVYRWFRGHGQNVADSFHSTQRVYRGAPVTGGAAFTKDNVYLAGLLTVHTFFRWALKNQRMALCRNLFAGKLAQVILQCVRLGQSCRDGAHRVVRAADLSGHHLPEERLLVVKVRVDRLLRNPGPLWKSSPNSADTMSGSREDETRLCSVRRL